MGMWTFLLWFEPPTDLDAAEGAPHLSSTDRYALLEAELSADPRWALRRTRIAEPVGRGEKQTLLLFIAAEAETAATAGWELRERVTEVVSNHVPGAGLTWVMNVTESWTDDQPI